MKKQTLISILLALGCSIPALFAAEPAPNTLSESEKTAGWKLLFDGATTAGWHNFGKTNFTGTNGWVVQEGWLKKLPKRAGGDIVTAGQFDNYELAWEWQFPRRCNNGIKYFVTEKRDTAPGHEFQMIDDATQKQRKYMTGSFYDVLPPAQPAALRFAPESNQARLVVRGNHVEHWVNGLKVLEYECGSPAVKEGVAKSKFKNSPGFGDKVKGRILLTDHSDECWYRNVKIRELPAAQ